MASLPICQKTFINTEPGLGKDVMSPFLPGKGMGKTKRGRAPCNLSGRGRAVLLPSLSPARLGRGWSCPAAPGQGSQRPRGSAIKPWQCASVQPTHPAQNDTLSPRRAAALFSLSGFSFWLFVFCWVWGYFNYRVSRGGKVTSFFDVLRFSSHRRLVPRKPIKKRFLFLFFFFEGGYFFLLKLVNLKCRCDWGKF